jgi:arylsulfatase A-like enzyme
MRIKQATHFDVMPTICDLVGVSVTTPVLGDSLFNNKTRFNHCVYATTRKKDAPSCFGYITPTHKYMVDLVYGRHAVYTLNDELIENLTGQKKEAMQAFFYDHLKTYGLLNAQFKEYGAAITQPSSDSAIKNSDPQQC